MEEAEEVEMEEVEEVEEVEVVVVVVVVVVVEAREVGCTTLMAAVAVAAVKSNSSAARQPATMSDLKIMPCAASAARREASVSALAGCRADSVGSCAAPCDGMVLAVMGGA